MEKNICLNRECKVCEDTWNKSNRNILWGWKRDKGNLQRIIYFKAELNRNAKNKIVLKDWFFFYRHRADKDSINKIFKILSKDEISKNIGKPRLLKTKNKDLSTIELSGGPGFDSSKDLLTRLVRRKPRKKIPEGEFAKPTREKFKLEPNKKSIVLYAGSGLSYETGLPTLAEIHELFGVDVVKE